MTVNWQQCQWPQFPFSPFFFSSSNFNIKQLLKRKKKNHNTVAQGGHLTHKTETYKTNTVGEKSTKLTRTKGENDRLGHILKSSIFAVQKAAAPKNGIEFCQSSNGSIRSSLATSCEVSRHRARSPDFDQSEALKLSQTNTQIENQHTVRPCSMSSACKNV